MQRRVLAFLSLMAVGLVGIASLLPTLGGAVAAIGAMDPARPMGDAALRLLLLAQPVTLLAIGVVAGLAAAHRVGLESAIVARVRDGVGSSPVGYRLAIAGGVTAGLIVVLGDLAFATIDPAAFTSLRVPPEARLEALTVGMLYGGLTKEIVMRWG